ncbi:MAG: hypothetical protein V3V17_03635 [Alphaproteobacteria bacterium]
MSKNRHREDRAAETREPPPSEARTGIGLFGLFRLGGIAFVITFALMSLVMSSDSIRGSLAIGAHADGDGATDHLDRGLIYLEQGYVSFSCAAAVGGEDLGARPARARDSLGEVLDRLDPGAIEAAEPRLAECVAQAQNVRAIDLVDAQYLRGVWYAEQALTALSCAARLDKGNTGLRAAKFRDGIVAIVGPTIAESAAHAAQKCVEAFDAGHHAQAGGDLPTFHRLGWVTRIFFAPGDIVVIGIMDIASELRLDFIRAAVQTMLSIFGDILIGAISLTVWLAALRLAMLVIKPFTGVMFRGQGSGTDSGVRGVQKERKELIPGRGGAGSLGR